MTDRLFSRVCEEYLTSRGWSWCERERLWKHPIIKDCGLSAIATISGVYDRAISVAEMSNLYDPATKQAQ